MPAFSNTGRVFYGTPAPASPKEGDVWFDQGNGGRLYLFVANAWQTPPLNQLQIGAGTAMTRYLVASKTQDFASLADAATALNTTVTVTGAVLGDFAAASIDVTGGFPAGFLVTAQVTATDTVTVTIFNKSGATVDLGSGTLRVCVWR